MNEIAHFPAQAFAPEFARRIEMICATLITLVRRRYLTLGARTIPLWFRLQRASTRLVRLMDRLAAGTLRPARPRRGKRTPGVRTPQPPTANGWLVHQLGYHAAGCGSQLEALLREPDLAALLAAAPTAGRTLRPLCRLLGVPLPPALQPAKPVRAAPASTRPPRPVRTKPKPVAPIPTAPEAPPPLPPIGIFVHPRPAAFQPARPPPEALSYRLGRPIPIKLR